ncbi:VWA domain-containing protein [Rhodobacteraceae bacterium HSP-20]|uniref:VWA domain-containing protein n=1 Tax=Paragemmobacter amnigenus TaxID=2852097 RepID=A0ABS6J8C1_9RHOB|nr:phage tail protein [Rhodobacter amnigenus]MBU9699986.1 VWA domain-containing protein [Rhodobacter amnigenus]MBV4391213.1 VWA domain-containing protein [Rhodobacter amnigenus]
MGGRSKAQTVGYRYSLGVHLALCHGPVDAIREILVDRRTAWSVTTGGGSSGGGGAAVETRIGTVAGMAATAALAGDSGATLNFPGTRAGVGIGRDYRLALANGSSQTITLQAVTFDAATNITRWTVLPEALSFPTQSVEVFEATTGASNTGAGGGRIRIDKPDLFGGESREGGIRGDVDVLMGGPSQGPNDYLAARMGGDVPAYRSLCSLVLRQVYLGINPYLKPWAVRVTRVLTGEAGAAQWYPEKAAIVPEANISDAAIYIALDVSGSMSGTRMAAQKAGVAALIREIAAGVDPDRPNDIRIVLWNVSVAGSIERRNMEPADYAALDAWMLGLSNFTNGGTSFNAAFAEANTFFAGGGSKRRIVIFVTDGEPAPVSSVDAALAIIRTLPPADIFGFNISLANTAYTAQIDNTPVDGVPVIPPGNPQALVASLRGAFGNGPDMNPAHIIRECLTNRDWGLGYSSVEIGPSFTGAADALYTEGFGLSLIWQKDSSIEEFIASVLDHIDATLFIDRRTGLWELKLIRADYVAASLPLFDETNVVDWGRLGRRSPSDLVNSVTVRFTDAWSDDTGAVSVTDTARVQAMGEVLATTLDYPGIRYQGLALRVAERDLRALSAPLLTGEIVVNREGADLGPGDVIRLRSTRLGLDDVVMRISEIGQGDGRDNGIRLKIAEDVFALGATAIAGGRMPTGTGVAAPPRALARRMVEEAPYWLLVRELGHSEADRRLAEDPDAGALVATGERPSADALAAQLWIDPGTGPAPEGVVAFAPTALLAADVTGSPEARVIPVTGWRDIGEVEIGTLASIDGELVRVDGITPTSITVGRGCLDTVPRAHASGTPVIFFDEVARITEDSWAAGETLAARLLPETGRGTLAFALAPEDSVTLDRRGIRPLPPGRVQGNGSYELNVDALVMGPLAMTWTHRDRLTQTSPVIVDHTGGSIGPEPGVGYIIEVRWVDPDTGAAILPAGVVIDAGSDASWSLAPEAIPELGAPDRTAEIELAVRSRRLVEGSWVTDREARWFRLTAPFAAGWDRGWGFLWGT